MPHPHTFRCSFVSLGLPLVTDARFDVPSRVSNIMHAACLPKVDADVLRLTDS